MLHFNGWQELDEEAAAKFEIGDVAKAVACAIESSVYEGDVIITGLSLMPTRAGMEVHAVDAARISRSGKLPLIVLLVEPSGPSVAMRALPDCHPTFSGSPLVLWGPHIIYRTDIDATVAKPIPSNFDRGN